RTGRQCVAERTSRAPAFGRKELSVDETAVVEQSLHERRGGAGKLERHRGERGQAGLVAARCAVRCRGRGKEMGTSDHVPRFLLTAVGARRGADGSVRDSVRTGQGYLRQTSDAVGSGVSGKMV